MFSKFLHSLAVFFFSHNISGDSEISLQIDQQIQIELEQAAARGMVSTRSQDNTPITGTSQNVERGKKRKTSKEREDSSAPPATKRRRGSANLDGEAALSSSAREQGRPRRRGSARIANDNVIHVIDHKDSVQEPSLQGSPTTPAPLPGINSDQMLEDEEDKAVEVVMKKPDSTEDTGSEALVAHERVKLGVEGATQSLNGRAKKKKMKDSERVVNAHKNSANVDTKSKKSTESFTTAAKPSHKRFGSEEIEVPSTISTIGIEERKAGPGELFEDESASEDEAPEMVTASAGFDKARKSALEAAKIAARYYFRDLNVPIVGLKSLTERRQRAEKKIKRREHGQRLKLQANLAKYSQHSDKPSTKARREKGSSTKVTEADSRMPVEESESVGEAPKTIEEEDEKQATTSKLSGKRSLPLLLPDEVLAAQPVIPDPKRPYSNSKVAIRQKRKFLDYESKPPKDIKRGDVTIRVLQDKRSVLPPRSSELSKTLRESWLTGRRGFKGEIGVPRRKLGGGFVRRR